MKDLKYLRIILLKIKDQVNKKKYFRAIERFKYHKKYFKKQ